MSENTTPWEQSYLAKYAVEAIEASIGTLLQSHFQTTQAFFQSLPEAKADFAYADGKWTVRQLIGHVVDSQIIFMYRALAISRGEAAALLGFDENRYAEFWKRSSATLKQVADLYQTNASMILAQVAQFPPHAFNLPGVANRIVVTPLVIFRALIGHERHHVKIMQERYVLGTPLS